MCLYPRLIKNRKYTVTKKNGGNVPPVKDPRTKYVPIGCQQCIECKQKKAREWSVRLQEDIRTNKNAQFVTLTLSTESYKKLYDRVKYKLDKETGELLDTCLDGYELDNEIIKTGIRKFLERWRKKYKKSVRHWLVTELGHNGTENIHVHGLIWTNNKNSIEERWQYGFVYIGDYVNNKTINYITKYVSKMDFKHKEYNSKIFTSAGIGSAYKERLAANLNKYKENGKTNERYTTRQGVKLGLPIYFRNMIYTDEEKEKLWIEKLDKEERWIMGKKIDISKGEKEYYSTLEWYQKKNIRLGYGTGEINWDRQQYERERRNLIVKERINKMLLKEGAIQDGEANSVKESPKGTGKNKKEPSAEKNKRLRRIKHSD